MLWTTYGVWNQSTQRHTIYVENPSNAKGKNHGHQPATISLSQEFGLHACGGLQENQVSTKPLRSGPSLRRRASASLRQKPGQYPEVNLEQLQQIILLKLYPITILRKTFFFVIINVPFYPSLNKRTTKRELLLLYLEGPNSLDFGGDVSRRDAHDPPTIDTPIGFHRLTLIVSLSLLMFWAHCS